MSEHRELERASGGRINPAECMIRMPGETKYEKRRKTTKEIALQISLNKIDKKIKALTDG